LNFKDTLWPNCQVTLADGSTVKIDANQLHNDAIDNWKGWSCEAGMSRLHIEADLTVYSGECKNDILGNLSDGWTEMKQLTICKRERCTGCTDDLLVSKCINNSVL